MRTLLLLLITGVILMGETEAKVRTQAVEYESDGIKLQGYLAYDDAHQGKRPAVLIVHEWWGLNDYPKKRAEEIAKLGYVAFAADIYGKGVIAKTPEEAGKLASQFRNDRMLARKRVTAALEVLKKYDFVDAGKIAAIGYCFGGMVALELARSGADLKGVVGFHTSLDTPRPDDARNIKGKILICTGANDKSVPPEMRQNFQKEMDNAGVDWQMNIYSGAVHAFTNPNAGNDPTTNLAYNANADHRSWQAMTQFFQEIFK
ncbi:MAG: dienelactone hydrolase family protein [Ignavibacteria bacterium]|jgi:dienelactone hydrolase|nr:dienelactone hydrolase family protein [Ignavibacteria bacterium]MCU7504667.1 dienelactone hydrolase family protein [Ignavibacteria bacterium]MCU7517525.1 dienelactone hydrolase family protein [Ignavibacteria bacterium]